MQMSEPKIWEGDNWKNAKGETVPECRSEQQNRANAAYALGRITVEEWRKEFDRLSEPTRECFTR